MQEPAPPPSPLGPQVIFGIDRHGTCTLSVGPGLAAQGLRPGELVGQNLFTVYSDHADALRRALDGESFTASRVVNRRFLSTYFEPVHAPDGSVDGALGVATDMTDFVLAQEDLIKFRALADASPDLIAIADQAGRPVYVNPQVTATGLAVSSENIWDTVLEQTGADVSAEIRSRVHAGERWSGDLPLHLPGRETVVHAQAFALFHPSTGAPLGSAWIAQDITELRASEAAHRAANSDLAQFRSLVEASRDFISIAGLDGAVRYVNPAGRRLIGMPADADVTTTRVRDYLTPDGFRRSVESERPAVVEHGHWEGPSTLRHASGEPIPVEVSSFLIRDQETDEPFALATVRHDIRERLAAEAELRALAQQREALLGRLVDAQEAERATIAAGVHDDPIQALATVDLRLHVLRRKIGEEAPQLLDLLTPLQDSVSGALSRLRALIFELEPPDLDRGLAGALTWAAGELFRDSSVQVRIEADDAPVLDDATASLAYRILREALLNVRKHAEATGVAVTLRTWDGGLEATVTDDGLGIGPGPYAAVAGHRGLTSMQDRAEVAGGRCEIGPVPGGGTQVCLWLPRAAAVAGDVPRSDLAADAGALRPE